LCSADTSAVNGDLAQRRVGPRESLTQVAVKNKREVGGAMIPGAKDLRAPLDQVSPSQRPQRD
jgi:hypothetical protein